MRAVALWDHQPSAQAILERRLERGWRPTPSALKDGPTVLGYAACMASVEAEIASR